MGGKMSRDKGGRVERGLVAYLKALGWNAKRVPLSGAMEGYKTDVVAEKNGREVFFECKARAADFNRIYQLYSENTSLQKDDLVAVAVPGARHLCMSMSSSLDAVLSGAEIHVHLEKHPLFEKFKRTFSKLSKMEQLLGEADILVLKGDHKPFLFVKWF